MIYRLLLVLIAITTLSSNAFASFLLVSDQQDSYDLTNYIEYYKDDAGTLTIDKIKNLPDSQWKRSKYTQYGFYKGRIWLRIKIDFTSTSDTWFISEKTSTFDSFDFYNTSYIGYIKEEYGLFINRPYLFKSRSMLIKPNHEIGATTYYASVKTGTPMLFIFTLLNKSALNDKTFKESLLLGIYYGAALICLMLHLFIYFSLSRKDTVYIYYCISVASLAVLSFYIQGLRSKLLGPPWTVNDLGFNFDNPATTFSIFIGLATFSWYSIAYLQLRVYRYVWINRYFLSFVASILIVFIPLLFVRSSAFMAIFGAMKICFSLTIPFLAIYIYRKGNYLPALYFAMAATFSTAGFAIYYLTIWGLVKGSHFTAYSAVYMAIPEFTLIAFSLASRINEMQKEHEHKLNQNILELTEARNSADKANQMKDEFLATSSHELKTPLNAIYGYMQIMRDTRLDAVQENCVEGSTDQVEQLNKLVDDLLDYSRIEKGMLSYDVQSAIPAEIILSTVQSIAPRPNRSVEMTVKIIDKSNVSKLAVGIDPVRFRQLAVNLITNALKFTDKGVVNIYLYCNPQKNSTIKYVLEVKDTGIGISKDQLDQIFRKFHQISKGTDRQRDGIGLGLAIVKSIAELFSGTIEVQSVPNIGSTFTFTFTASIYQEPVKHEEADQFPNERTHPIAILLVEDHYHNRNVFQYMVNNIEAVRLDIAESVDDAIQLCKKNSYSGIFIDLHMPGKDGYALANHIRNDLNDQLTPLIAVSADCKPSTKMKCRMHGFNDFIDKPIKKYLLHSKIREIIKSHETTKNIINKAKSTVIG